MIVEANYAPLADHRTSERFSQKCNANSTVTFVKMLGLVLVILIAVGTIASGEILPWDRSLRDVVAVDVTSRNSRPSEREGKFFPLFSVVRFANNECAGSNNFNGTCFTKRECSKFGGTGYGTCANKLGVCCVFRKVCGSTTNMNNTYFVNPNYPITYDGGERCIIKVSPCNSNICQLRIDFLDFSIAQPNASGVCDYDFLRVSGGSTIVPTICGDNLNEHVYVEFNNDNPIVISVDTDPTYMFDRRWNLRIQQIACDSPWRAPNGCLQYYKTVTGSVKSFNYGTVANPRVSALLGTSIGTRQLLNLNYGVCVRMALGYCSIEWSQSDPYSFAVSGDSAVFDPSIVDDFAESGTTCNHTYVIVPNPSLVNGTRLDVGRFCGNGFETKTTNSKPFVMWVVTNPNPVPLDAMTDFENRGFILKYRQLPCPLNY